MTLEVSASLIFFIVNKEIWRLNIHFFKKAENELQNI